MLYMPKVRLDGQDVNIFGESPLNHLIKKHWSSYPLIQLLYSITLLRHRRGVVKCTIHGV